MDQIAVLTLWQCSFWALGGSCGTTSRTGNPSFSKGILIHRPAAEQRVLALPGRWEPTKLEHGWLTIVPRCHEVLRQDVMEGALLPAPALAAPGLSLDVAMPHTLNRSKVRWCRCLHLRKHRDQRDHSPVPSSARSSRPTRALCPSSTSRSL